MTQASGRQVRMAVLGAAGFAEVAHIPGVNAHPQGEVVALYSRDLNRARQMAARTGVPEATDDLERLLARDDIHAVTVPSSNDRHHPYTMAALRARKHVFCEKPMALSADQAAEMTREARRRGAINQIAFIFRYTYCMEELRQRVRNGEIGTPHYVEIHGEGLTREVVEPGMASWRTYAALHSAGHLGEMGPHFIDTINYVCGPTAGFVSAVAAITHRVPRDARLPDGGARPLETLDLASFLFRTERGLQGHVLLSRVSPPPVVYGVVHAGRPQGGHMGYVIVSGDRGALMATFTRGEVESLRRMKPGGRWEPVPLPPEAVDGQPHGIQRMLGSFVDSVLTGRANAQRDPSFEDGYRSQSAIDAIMAAGQSRRWEPVATGLRD